MTPDLQLRTIFALDRRGRIVSTREPPPNRNPGPAFVLIRGPSSCAWAVRIDVPAELEAELDRLAGEEPPIRNFEEAPVHADKFVSLVGGDVYSGPAFEFPENIDRHPDIAMVTEFAMLERHFRRWVEDEMSERSPIMAVMHEGYPVSVCFCARNTEEACEAGVETAEGFRDRGFAPRVTAAWAHAIRASGRIPLYSTSWTNSSSLVVARKLGLIQYATDWNVTGKP